MPIAQQTALGGRERRRQAPVSSGGALDAPTHAATLAESADPTIKGKNFESHVAAHAQAPVLPPPVVSLPPVPAEGPFQQAGSHGLPTAPRVEVKASTRPAAALVPPEGDVGHAPPPPLVGASGEASESDPFVAALHGPGSVAGTFAFSPARVADRTLSGVGDAASAAARDFRHAALAARRRITSRLTGATAKVAAAFNSAAASVLSQLDEALNDALATLSSYGYGVADEILLTAAGSDVSGTAAASGGVLASNRQQHLQQQAHQRHHLLRHAPAEAEEDDDDDLSNQQHYHDQLQRPRSSFLHHPLSPVEMTEIRAGAKPQPPYAFAGSLAPQQTATKAESAFGATHERVEQMRQNLHTQAEQQAVDAKLNSIDAATASDYLGPESLSAPGRE